MVYPTSLMDGVKRIVLLPIVLREYVEIGHLAYEVSKNSVAS